MPTLRQLAALQPDITVIAHWASGVMCAKPVLRM